MSEIRYMISETAKQVDVEAHVLRYWEEELSLPIDRNEMGHRYYTEDDITLFKNIKELKERGFQLKAIKMLLPELRRNGRLDMDKLLKVKGALMQVTAPGMEGYDCVSRSFAPKMGVPEDPVCGSGHCHIIPYWAQKLGKTRFVARQASPRGGTLYCRLEGDRVILAGRAVLYARSELMLEDRP